jgi:branched-chain amino acid transport system permease protein
MSFSTLLIQLLNGLADASALFLVASGLTLIFGVTRIVNFAHGSFYMLGIYVAYTLVARLGTSVAGFWTGVLLSGLVVGAIGALIEVVILRRIYRAPELFQLLATFALVLIFKDIVLLTWGAEELFGPRAPGFSGAVILLGQRFPTYDLVLIALGPIVLGSLWLLLKRSRWGTLVRAATQDREMVGALGINQASIFTAVFALGCLLAGLGGALQGPRVPANLGLDMDSIGSAFAVVVVGGMGSLPGAFVAALIIAEVKALCIALGDVSFLGVAFSAPKLTLVVESVVMAIVLVIRPWGLFGRPTATLAGASGLEPVLRASSINARRMMVAGVGAMLLLPLVTHALPYLTVLSIDILIAILFAASLHFIMGPGGMHSFGHAAYFGLGAYGAALVIRTTGLNFEAGLLLGAVTAAAGALVFGWFCVRLSGVYLAMLTLAFGQLVWAVIYQWDAVTGGSNGLIGLRVPAWLDSRAAYYYMTISTVLLCLWLMRRVLFSPFGYAMRASRDSELRAGAIGIDVKRVQWMGFVIAGFFGGVAGCLFAYAKGSISPEALHVAKSIDGLVMVLLGGVQTLGGPVVGAAVFVWLQDTVMRYTEYWRAVMGAIILLLVVAFPQGIVGFAVSLFNSRVRKQPSDLAPLGTSGPITADVTVHP